MQFHSSFSLPCPVKARHTTSTPSLPTAANFLDCLECVFPFFLQSLRVTCAQAILRLYSVLSLIFELCLDLLIMGIPLPFAHMWLVCSWGSTKSLPLAGGGAFNELPLSLQHTECSGSLGKCFIDLVCQGGNRAFLPQHLNTTDPQSHTVQLSSPGGHLSSPTPLTTSQSVIINYDQRGYLGLVLETFSLRSSIFIATLLGTSRGRRAS